MLVVAALTEWYYGQYFSFSNELVDFPTVFYHDQGSLLQSREKSHVIQKPHPRTRSYWLPSPIPACSPPCHSWTQESAVPLLPHGEEEKQTS